MENDGDDDEPVQPSTGSRGRGGRGRGGRGRGRGKNCGKGRGGKQAMKKPAAARAKADEPQGDEPEEVDPVTPPKKVPAASDLEPESAPKIPNPSNKRKVHAGESNPKPKRKPTGKPKAKPRATKASPKKKANPKSKPKASPAKDKGGEAATAPAAKACAAQDQGGEAAMAPPKKEKSFARRWRPAGTQASLEWQVLRDVFLSHVAPSLDVSAGKAEDCMFVDTLIYVLTLQSFKAHLKACIM